MKRANICMMILLALALLMTGAALAEGEYAEYAGWQYSGEDPWGGILTATIRSIEDGRMEWTFTDLIEDFTLYQEIEGTELSDGSADFHISGADIDRENVTFDYSGAIELRDGALYMTFEDGAVTVESPEGGYSAYHAGALDDAERTVKLRRPPKEDPVNIDRFCGTWVDGDLVVEIAYDLDEDAFQCTARLGLNDGNAWVYETCRYDEAGDCLACGDGTRYYVYYDADAKQLSSDTVIVNLTADFSFAVSGEDVLLWNDSEGIAKRFELRRLADVEQEDREEAQAFLGRWGSGRCTIDITDLGNDTYDVTITWGSSAWEHAEWHYVCACDGTKGALYSIGRGVETIVTYDDSGEIASTETVYEDGAATFAIDDDDRLIWNDAKENAAEGMLFERGVMM